MGLKCLDSLNLEEYKLLYGMQCPVVQCKSTHVSEEYTAFIFRIQEHSRISQARIQKEAFGKQKKLSNTKDRMVTPWAPWQQNRYDIMKASVLLQILKSNLLIKNGCRRCRELGR
jgi:hypothetical protein